MTDQTLTGEERERYTIIRSSITGDIKNAEAAARLRLTVRQVQRLKRLVEKYDEIGVVHGNRGQASKRKTKESTKKAVVTFLKKKDHRDFGPTFAMEQLAKQKQITLSRETVRTLMITEGLWKGKCRKGPTLHREWRERRALRGELIQFDGSYHHWYENGEEQCVLAAIDDATSHVTAIFEDNEGVYAVFRFWDAYFKQFGLPVAIYLDKFSTYKINHKNAVDNEEMMTQFRRAMNDLGVKVICANSPQAKGRVERLFSTMQNRLVKEMRLVDIKTREPANHFLTNTYLPDHNERFAVPAKQSGDAHRPLPDDVKAKLPSILSVQSKRRVNNDFTVRFKNRWYQLEATQQTTVYKGDVVVFEERLDGTTHMRLKEMYLAYAELPARPRPTRMRVTALTSERPRVSPPLDHPWRKVFRAGREKMPAKKLRNAI